MLMKETYNILFIVCFSYRNMIFIECFSIVRQWLRLRKKIKFWVLTDSGQFFFFQKYFYAINIKCNYPNHKSKLSGLMKFNDKVIYRNIRKISLFKYYSFYNRLSKKFWRCFENVLLQYDKRKVIII